MKEPIIYIAGPVSGQPDLNRAAFYEADKALKKLGFITRNPHEFCADIRAAEPEDPAYYRRGIEVLVRDCTDVILLPDWQYSVGATMERNVANACCIQTFESIGDLISKYSND